MKTSISGIPSVGEGEGVGGINSCYSFDEKLKSHTLIDRL